MKIDYHTLVDITMTTSGTTSETLIYDRKFSDYDLIMAIIGNNSRGTMLLPRALFATQAMYVGFMYSGALREVDVTYVSDTSCSIQTVGVNEKFRLIGIKLM